MGFINSPLLWFTLGATAVVGTILIHYLRRYRLVQWGAMELLQRVLRVRRRRVRMEDLIVLILRCLAVALLAAALLRPTVLRHGGWRLFGDQAVGAVIAIDASFSMNHGDIATRFSDARAKARAVLETVKPGSPVSIVLMGSRPHVLLRNVGYDERVARKVLDEASALPEQLNLDASVDLIRQLVDELKAPAKECYLVTDGQTASWSNLMEKAQADLRAMTADEDNPAKIFCIPVETSHDNNLAISRLSFAGGTLRKGAVASYVAEVVNHGIEARKLIPVTLEVDDEVLDTRVIPAMAPGEHRLVAFNIPFESAGSHRLMAHIEGGGSLETDMARYRVADVPAATRILCIDGDHSPVERSRSETFFLAKALNLKGFGAAVGLEVEVVGSSVVESRRLTDESFVVLANVPHVSQATADQLSTMVRNGGSLVIFLGDQVNADALNASLGVEDGLLPGRLQAQVALPEGEEATITVAASGHPVGRALERLPRDLLRSTRIWGYFRCHSLPEARTVLGLSDGGALIVEKSYGQGRVVLFASSADRAWNDLAVHPLNPIWLHNMISHLNSVGRVNYTVGQVLALSVDARDLGPDVHVLTPAGDSRRGVVEHLDESVRVDLGTVSDPGFYEVNLRADAPRRLFAANVQPEESDVRALSAAELAASLEPLGIEVLTGSNIAREVVDQRIGFEIWSVLLILALLALVGQALLGDLFSHKTLLSDKIIVGAQDSKPVGLRL